MKASPVLNRYLARAYTLNLLAGAAILLAVVYLFDTVELMRRAGKMKDVPLGLVLEMGFLKLPDVGMTAFPFAVLFSAIFTFWQFTRRYELIVMRSTGFSVWQFLMPAIAISILCGVLLTAVFNPAGSILMSRFKVLENDFLTHNASHMALFDEGLWLRQMHEDGYVVLHAARVQMPEWHLQDVMALYFDNGDSLQKRVDSKSALLDDKKGMWLFGDAVISKPHEKQAAVDMVALPTELTGEEIEDSFSSPDTMSFWNLPAFIRTMEATGFDATRLRIHFQNLISQPFLFAAMVLLAAAVAMRPPRQRGAFFLVVSGVLCGFAVFFLSNFLQALGATHQLPVMLAAWSPALITLFLGFTAILSLEDG